jgi:thiol-disulfide isomerase/thioredoxin
MRALLAAEMPDSAAAVGKRLVTRAPWDARLRAWYIASLDQAKRFDELWAFVRRCQANVTEPWRMVECAYELSTRPDGWRSGLDSADKVLRVAVSRRPADAALAVLATKLLVRRAEYSTHAYAPVLAFLDSAVARTTGDYDVRAWRAAIRYDAAGVSPVDSAAQRAALAELGALRDEFPTRLPAFHFAAERLMRRAPAEALPIIKRAVELQPRSVELRRDYWTVLSRVTAASGDARRDAIGADIAVWLVAMDSTPAAMAAASQQLRDLKADAEARRVDDRLLARSPLSREADDLLWRRARQWNDSLRAVSDSTSRHPAADSARLSAARIRALDSLVFGHRFVSRLARGNAASDLLWYVRADTTYPAARLLETARLVHGTPMLQMYFTHAITAVALAERRVALAEAERWTVEGLKNVLRELDDMRSLYPSTGEFIAAMERWQTLFMTARAFVQIAGRQYTAAESTLARAEALSPGDAGVQYQLGRLRLIQHRRDDAELAFVRALDGSDVLDINESRRALERLYRQQHGSLEDWDRYLSDVRRREKETRQSRVLASALPEPSRPPSFALTALDGQVVASESLKGKIVIVNFWGTWCGPCVGEMPALQKLYEAYRSDTAVAIVTIAKDELTDLQRFMAAKQLTLPTLLDDGYSARAAIDVWPTTWVLDRDGSVRYRPRTTPERLVEEWSWIIEAMRNAPRRGPTVLTPP